MKIEIQNASAPAQVRAASFREADNSIEVIWTTGAPVRRRGASGYFDEVLVVAPGAVRLDRLNTGAPFLDSHKDGNLSNVIGSVIPRSAKIVSGKGVARIALSRAASDADNVQKIKDGIIRNISVGYTIHKVEIVERENDVPIYRVSDWEPLEISAVPIPADTGAQIRNSSSETKVTKAEARTLARYSVEAARVRMWAKMARCGLWPEARGGH